MSQTKADENKRRLLKLKNACEYLSMSRWQVRKLVASGQLRFIQVEPRSHLLFDTQDLDALIDSLKQKN
jgi:excisionase family DNA binding protein